jgi:hypothetical protein
MLVTGSLPQGLALIGLLGTLLLRDTTGHPAWTRVGHGLGFLAAGWTGRRYWQASERRQVPPLLDGVRIEGCRLPHGVMGVAVDQGRYLAAMRLASLGNPWLQSPQDREVAADDWARLVASLPFETIDRLQILTVVRQGAGEELVVDAATAKGPGREVLAEAAGHLTDEARRIDTIAVIRLTTRAGREVAERGGLDEVGRLLHSTLQHLGGQLPAEAIWAEILAPADWTDLVSSVLHRDDLPDVGVVEMEESWAAIRTDQTWHRMLWVWDWPQRPTAVGFLAPLLGSAGDRVVSLEIEPADPEPHQRSLDFAYRRAEAAVATATGGKHRKQAELTALDHQLTEINQGHVPVRALITTSVSSTDRTQLDDLTRRLRSNVIASSCRIAVSAGIQAGALNAVLPYCRGLDREAGR